MGTDADLARPSAVSQEHAPSRRAFMKRLGVASLGAAAAAPVVGSASAAAQDGGTPAYTNLPNNFTADQQFSDNVGIGAAPLAHYPLYVSRTDDGTAAAIVAKHQALVVRQRDDLAGDAHDTFNVFHRGTGDAVYVDHKGGKPPGYGGPVGGNAGLNVVIPYNLDAQGTGREGSVRNDRTGMKAIFIQTQATNDDVTALEVHHFSNSYLADLTVQPPGYPVGTGGGILINDYSPACSLTIGKWTKPRSGDAIVRLENQTSAPVHALRVNEQGGATKVLLQSDGTLALGHSSPFAVRLHVDMRSNGTARALALSNGTTVNGSGVQLEFDDRAAQYAQIAAIFDEVSAGSRRASLRFSVLSNDRMTERLRVNHTGIGFFGATPVAKPVVSGSRNSATALRNLLQALASLGLITDSTSN
jgi:hypothetical protein